MFGFLLFLIVFGYIAYLLFGSRRSITTDFKKIEEPAIEFPARFIWAVIMVLIGFNFFAYDVNYGIGTGLLNVFVLGAAFYLFPSEKRTPSFYGLLAISLVAGFGIGYRANGFVQSVNSAVVLGVVALLILFHALERVKWQGLWLVKYLLTFIPRGLKQALSLARQSQRPNVGNKITFVSVVKTTLITVVVLAFFAGILSNADPIFAQLIDQIKEEAIGRAIASVVLAIFLTIALTIKFSHKEDDEIVLGFLSFHDLVVPLLGVVILFGIFILVQVRYLFGSHADLAAFDLTYAEYVRKGFMELLTAAFFGGLFAYVVTFKQRLWEVSTKVTQLQVLTSLLIGELFFVLVSAFKRDLMYVEVYGLTRVRIIGGVFLIWLAVALGLLLAFAVLRKMKEQMVLAGLLMASAFVVLALNIINVDQVIAKAEPPRDNSKDYFYINSLSEDAWEGWAESVEAGGKVFENLRSKTTLTEGEKEGLAHTKLSMLALQEKKEELFKNYGTTEEALSVLKDEYWQSNSEADRELPKYLDRRRAWQSSIMSEKRAYQYITRNPELFARVDELITLINSYQDLYHIDLYEQEYALLYEYQYPFVDVRLNYFPRTVTPPKELGSPSPSPSLWPSVSPSVKPSSSPTPSPSLTPAPSIKPRPSNNPRGRSRP